MESASSVGPCPDDGEFVANLTSHQGMLRAYLNTLLPGDPDVAQQTSIVLWRKRAEFQPGTSFRAWLLRVAYWEARELDDAGPPKVRFYVDGREDPATRANRDAVFPVETRRGVPLSIGRAIEERNLRGTIDELFVFEGELPGAAARELMNSRSCMSSGIPE